MKLEWRKIAPVFLLGLLLGALGGSLAQRAMMRHWRKAPDTSRILDKMSRELKLDAGQKESVKVLLESSRLKMEALHDESAARFKSLRAESRAEIRKLLTQEQQKRFDEMTARYESRGPHR